MGWYLFYMLSTNSGYNMLNRYQWKCKIAFRDIFNSVFKVCKWGTTLKLVTRLILVMLHAVGMAQSHFMKHHYPWTHTTRMMVPCKWVLERWLQPVQAPFTCNHQSSCVSRI